MDIVRLQKVEKVYGDVRALDGVTLSVGEGEMLCLLGPSGCGKTTLLRTIAGFEKPTSGQVWLGGKDVTRTPPEKRNTALVFQNYALFPHMSVFENVAFGLKVRRWPMREISNAVKEILDLVGLSGLERRWVKQMSGGQQQRVALARALVIRPSVLLLDEPLSNLDAKLRLEMRTHIKSIQRSLNITSVFVTHDQEEALTMADRIVIMHQGRVVQVGAPREVYANPSCTFVADFIGKSNCLRGVVARDAAGPLFIVNGGPRVRLEGAAVAEGEAVLAVRPEELRLGDRDAASETENALPGILMHTTYLGEMAYHHVRLEGGSMLMVAEYGKQVRERAIDEEVVVLWPREAGTMLRS